LYYIACHDYILKKLLVKISVNPIRAKALTNIITKENVPETVVDLHGSLPLSSFAGKTANA
jgi:hypothetical protein